MNKIYRGKSGHFANKAEIAAQKAAEQAQSVLPITPASREQIVAYKGFGTRHDGALVCYGHTFEVKKEYNIPRAKPRACHYGFHACENPFDVFKYYKISDVNHQFGRVKLLGPFDRADSKIAAKGIIVEEIFHLAHLINLLAKYGAENPKAIENVASINNPNTVNNRSYVIRTQYDSHPFVVVGNYAAQMSTVCGIRMYHHGYDGVQFGAGDEQAMFSTGNLQVSAGNNSHVTCDSSRGVVDIRGKNNVVRLLKAGACFRGPVGTRFEMMGANKQIISGKVGENDIAPNKWTFFAAKALPVQYEHKIAQREACNESFQIAWT